MSTSSRSLSSMIQFYVQIMTPLVILQVRFKIEMKDNDDDDDDESWIMVGSSSWYHYIEWMVYTNDAIEIPTDRNAILEVTVLLSCPNAEICLYTRVNTHMPLTGAGNTETCGIRKHAHTRIFCAFSSCLLDLRKLTHCPSLVLAKPSRIVSSVLHTINCFIHLGCPQSGLK